MGQVAWVDIRLGGETGEREGGGAAFGEQVTHPQQPARGRFAAAYLAGAKAQQFKRQSFDDKRRRRVRALELVEQPNRQAHQRPAAGVERVVQ
jgi:hypothetical protein